MITNTCTQYQAIPSSTGPCILKKIATPMAQQINEKKFSHNIRVKKKKKKKKKEKEKNNNTVSPPPIARTRTRFSGIGASTSNMSVRPNADRNTSSHRNACAIPAGVAN